MAYRLGISQGTYSKIERGQSGLTPDHLIMLAKAFGINPTWLLLGKGSMMIKDSVSNSNILDVNIMVPASQEKEYLNAQYESLATVILPGIDGEARTFEVPSSEIEPKAYQGDWVVCKRSTSAMSKIGDPCVIVTKEEIVFTIDNGKIDDDDIVEYWAVVMKITRHFEAEVLDVDLSQKVGKIEQFLMENFAQYKPK